MKQTPTSKNHFIPCFWSAFWNMEYLLNLRSGKENKLKPRETILLTYGIKAKKLYSTKAEKLFYSDKANLARVENETDLKNLKLTFRNIQTNFEEFNNEDLYIFDYEDTFTCLENIYKEFLIKIIKRKTVLDVEDQTYISLFIYTQITRNPYYFRYFENLFNLSGISKLFLFTEIEKALTDQEFLFTSLFYFINNEWNIYLSHDYPFPITDFPFIQTHNSICICLAPDILLEIDMSKRGSTKINNYMIMNEFKGNSIIKSLLSTAKNNIVFSKQEHFNQI